MKNLTCLSVLLIAAITRVSYSEEILRVKHEAIDRSIMYQLFFSENLLAFCRKTR